MMEREEVLSSLRGFQGTAGYNFIKDLIEKHTKSKAQELADLLREADSKNDYMIYRLSGYLDGFENGANLIDSAINEIKKPEHKDEKPIY